MGDEKGSNSRLSGEPSRASAPQRDGLEGGLRLVVNSFQRSGESRRAA